MTFGRQIGSFQGYFVVETRTCDKQQQSRRHIDNTYPRRTQEKLSLLVQLLKSLPLWSMWIILVIITVCSIHEKSFCMGFIIIFVLIVIKLIASIYCTWKAVQMVRWAHWISNNIYLDSPRYPLRLWQIIVKTN